MKRAEFEHAIRAAGAVLGVRELLVIGSQALHASVTAALPPEASRSVEVDIAVLGGDPKGRMADLIDGSIGEASSRGASNRTTCGSPRPWLLGPRTSSSVPRC